MALKPYIIVMRIADAVDHGGVDRPGPRRTAGRRAGRTPCRRRGSMPPPPKSPTRLSGKIGLLALAPEVPERAAERDVVDVVAGHRRVGTVLTPSGHATEDEAGVALEADIGPEAEALDHAGPEALDETVGRLHQRQERLEPVGVLEVDADRAPAPVEDLLGRGRRVTAEHRLGAVDAQDLGAHVGQHHGAERSGADARRSPGCGVLRGVHSSCMSPVSKGGYRPASGAGPVGRVPVDGRVIRR